MKKAVLVILVIGLLILALAVIWWDSWKPFIHISPSIGWLADKTLCGGIFKALDAPNESVVSKNLKLPEGIAYTVRSFARCGNIEENCVEIQASDSNAFTVHQGKVIQVNDLIQTNVYYNCVLGATAGMEECPLFCTVSFGKELP